MTLFRPGGGEQRAVSYADVWGAGGDVSSSTERMTGESVSFATVIGLDAVAGAVGLMSDLVSMTPFHAYRDVGGVAQRMSTQPQVITQPSPSMSAQTWKAQFVVGQMLWGNSIGYVVDTTTMGYPLTVEWVDNAQVSVVERAPFGAADWFIGGRQVDASRIVHVPGRYVRPGSIMGLAPLERFSETFGLALAARRYGAEWFRDGASPSAVLQSDQQITAEQAAEVKRRWMLPPKREPRVLGAGLTYHPTQGNPSDSQMVEVEQQVINRVARIMGVPAEFIGGGGGGGGSITYANREQRAMDLLTYNADPLLVRLEQLQSGWLPQPQYVKAARGAFLRTDLASRFKAHDMAVRGGWSSVNEIRALEDQPPIEGGDVHLWPPYATSVAPPGGSDDDE